MGLLLFQVSALKNIAMIKKIVRKEVREHTFTEYGTRHRAMKYPDTLFPVYSTASGRDGPGIQMRKSIGTKSGESQSNEEKMLYAPPK